METITELERMAAAHWRGTEEEWLGDWLLRAAEGFTGRANSARVFLQVEVDNAPARALYERLGFRLSHRYHYCVAPV